MYTEEQLFSLALASLWELRDFYHENTGDNMQELTVLMSADHVIEEITDHVNKRRTVRSDESVSGASETQFRLASVLDGVSDRAREAAQARSLRRRTLEFFKSIFPGP